MATLKIEQYGKDANGVVGTMRAEVIWDGPWYTNWGPQVMDWQMEQLQAAFPDFTPLGEMTVTVK